MQYRYLNRTFLSICCVVCFTLPLQAADITANWTGGSNVWTSTTNWSAGVYPDNGNGGHTYTAVIDTPSIVSSVALNRSVTIDNLTLGKTGTITTNGLQGEFNLTVNNEFDWNGGIVRGLNGEKLTVASGGKLNINTTNGGILDQRRLVNNGDATLTGTGIFSWSLKGPVDNNGTFTANATSQLSIQGAIGGVINNAGSFTKKGDSSLTLPDITFNNTGNVDVQAGLLQLSTAGSHTGDFTGAAGATLQFGGGSGSVHTFVAGSDITGDLNVTFSTANSFPTTDDGLINIGGTFTCTSIGEKHFNGAVTASTFNLLNGPVWFDASLTAPSGSIQGGTLLGSATWTVTHALDWTGGTMGDTGQTAIATGATLNASKAITLSRTLTNNGTASWTGGGTWTLSNGTIQNNGSFSADLSTADFSIAGATGSTNNFNNAGTFTKSGIATATLSGLNFTNAGTVDVQVGTLRFGDGAYLNQLSTGLLKGTGTVEGNVVSAGTVAPGSSPGKLTINGDYTQSRDGSLQIEIGGVTEGDQYDALNVTGLAIVSGALNVSLVNGFHPAAGQQFDIFDWGSITGSFDRVQLPALPNGLSWNTGQLYSSGVLTVVPEPSTWILLLFGSGLFAKSYRRRTAGAKPPASRKNMFTPKF